MKDEMSKLLKKEEKSKRNTLLLVKSFIKQIEEDIQNEDSDNVWCEMELFKILEAYEQNLLSDELPSYKKIIYLKKIGYRQVEIARILGKSSGLVSRLIRKARETQEL